MSNPTVSAYPIQSLKWTLPILEYHWYDSSKVRRAASCAFALLALASTAATIYSANWLRAAPKTIINAVIGWSLCSVAFAANAILFASLPVSSKDPIYRQKLLEEAKEHLAAHPETGYQAIRQRWNETIISGEMVNSFLTLDCKNMPYEQFIQKHTQQVLRILNEENLASLRPQVLSYLEMLIKNNHPPKEIQQLPEYALFKVQKREVYAHHWVTFRNNVLREEIGLCSFEAQYGQEIAYFDAASIKDLRKEIVLNEWNNGVYINYKFFRQRNGIDHVRELLEPAQELQLHGAFLQLPYQSFIDPKYEIDRIWLHVSDQHIAEELQRRWEVPLTDPKFRDLDGFFAVRSTPLAPLFPPGYWTQKALEDTTEMAVSAIARALPGLFRFQILKGTDFVLGMKGTLLDRLEKELSHVDSLEDVLRLFDPVLFECRLLSPALRRLSNLVTCFVLDHAERYLQGIHQGEISTAIERHQLMSSALVFCLGASRQEYADELARYEAVELQLEREYRAEIDQFNSQKSLAINNVKIQCGFDLKQAHKNNLETAYQRAQTEENQLNARLAECRAVSEKLPQQISQAMTEMQNLQDNYQRTLNDCCSYYQRSIIELINGYSVSGFSDELDLNQLRQPTTPLSSQKIDALMEPLQASIARLKQIFTDAQKQAESEIAPLQARVQEAEEQLSNLRASINKWNEAEQKLNEWNSEREKLRNEIDPQQFIELPLLIKRCDQPVQGIAAAREALADKQKYEEELTALQGKQKRLEELEMKWALQFLENQKIDLGSLKALEQPLSTLHDYLVNDRDLIVKSVNERSKKIEESLSSLQTDLEKIQKNQQNLSEIDKETDANNVAFRRLSQQQKQIEQQIKALNSQIALAQQNTLSAQQAYAASCQTLQEAQKHVDRAAQEAQVVFVTAEQEARAFKETLKSHLYTQHTAAITLIVSRFCENVQTTALSFNT